MMATAQYHFVRSIVALAQDAETYTSMSMSGRIACVAHTDSPTKKLACSFFQSNSKFEKKMAPVMKKQITVMTKQWIRISEDQVAGYQNNRVSGTN